MSTRFVKPDVVRIPVSEGDWIEIKRELTYGEQQRLAGMALVNVQPGAGGEGALGIDVERHALGKLQLWLTDWSFRDEHDKPVRLTRDAIAALNQETAEELLTAIDRHAEELEREKKAKTGAGASAATSASAGG